MRNEAKFYTRQADDRIVLYDILSQEVSEMVGSNAPRKFRCKNGTVEVVLDAKAHHAGPTAEGALTFAIAQSGLPVGKFVEENLSDSISLYLAETSNAKLHEKVELKDGQSPADVKPTKACPAGKELFSMSNDSEVKFYQVDVKVEIDFKKQFSHFLSAISSEPFAPTSEAWESALADQISLGRIKVKNQSPSIGMRMYSNAPMLIAAIPALKRETQERRSGADKERTMSTVSPAERRIESLEPALLAFLAGDDKSKSSVEKNDGLVYFLGYTVIDNFRDELIKFSGANSGDAHAEEVFGRVARLRTWLDGAVDAKARKANPMLRTREDICRILIDSVPAAPLATRQSLVLAGVKGLGQTWRGEWIHSEHFKTFIHSWADSLAFRNFSCDDEVLCSAWDEFVGSLKREEVKKICAEDVFAIVLAFLRSGIDRDVRNYAIFDQALEELGAGLASENEVVSLRAREFLSAWLASPAFEKHDSQRVERMISESIAAGKNWPLSRSLWRGISPRRIHRVFSAQLIREIESNDSANSELLKLVDGLMRDASEIADVVELLELPFAQTPQSLVEGGVAVFAELERSEPWAEAFVAQLLDEKLAARMHAESERLETERQTLVADTTKLRRDLVQSEELLLKSREESLAWRRLAESREVAGARPQTDSDTALLRALADLASVSLNVVFSNVDDTAVRDAFEARTIGALAKFGIRQFGVRGDSAQFSPDLHRLNRGTAEQGEEVVVVSCGYSRQGGEDEEVLIHAIVRLP